MKSIIAKGKTVDEAIFVGLMELGLSIDEVAIEIIDSGSKGLFGIGKSAQVSLTERDSQEIEQMQTAAKAAEKEQKERPDEIIAEVGSFPVHDLVADGHPLHEEVMEFLKKTL